MPLGTEEEVAGDPTGVTVERSESEKRRPDGEARNEPTRRVTTRAGASQRAIDAGRGGDTMRNPSRPPNSPERREGDSRSPKRRNGFGRQQTAKVHAVHYDSTRAQLWTGGPQDPMNNATLIAEAGGAFTAHHETDYGAPLPPLS